MPGGGGPRNGGIPGGGPRLSPRMKGGGGPPRNPRGGIPMPIGPGIMPGGN